MKRLLSLVLLVCSSLFLSGCNPLAYKAKSGLQVITGEVPSSVFLNNQYIGKTPLIEKSIKPGFYHVSIQPEDSEFVPYETDLSLRKGLLTVITWKPEKRPELSSGVILEMEKLENSQQTEVSFTTIPEGAIITLDGKKEFSPIVLSDVKPGVNEFEVTLPSYETQRHSVNVQQGYKMLVTVKLAKLQEIGKTDPAVVEDTTTATATPSPTLKTPVATATPVATPAKATTQLGSVAGGTVTILKTGFFQDGKEVLRVRETPVSSGKELGFAEVGSTHPYLGEQKNSWYKISFQGSTGWVNGAFAKLSQ